MKLSKVVYHKGGEYQGDKFLPGNSLANPSEISWSFTKTRNRLPPLVSRTLSLIPQKPSLHFAQVPSPVPSYS
ncbi:hypothetical protein O6P43_009643 [Quillaja saponaria]|uniref:Uncharacterized protein n=1 Tax=Quillaja saponaria TaxID=32244 RepID=A0AAD7PYS5_QUISA|nr:hypothetical protein O6P43_009643 [Quillaja saponaria]